jgi:hypothetical protein
MAKLARSAAMMKSQHSDGRLGQPVQRADRLMQSPLPPPTVEGKFAGSRAQILLHGGDIAAGAEGRAVSGDHHGANGVILGDAGERRDELGAQSFVDRVAHLRPVERDDGDRSVDRGLDGR